MAHYGWQPTKTFISIQPTARCGIDARLLQELSEFCANSREEVYAERIKLRSGRFEKMTATALPRR
jgi:hypothetical protein